MQRVLEDRSPREHRANALEQLFRQATAVTEAAAEASSNVQAVAAAVNELDSSITEIARQVDEAASTTAKAVDEVEATTATVEGLAAAAQRIDAVVKLISSIAGQTNLLALNATIGAARAGEAGRGFAVVAGEVKNLANQTSKATEEIGAQVADIQAVTTRTVAAIRAIGGTVAHVNEISGSIAAAVEEQTAAVKEISRNVQQAAHGTDEVSRNIAGVTRSATESGPESMSEAPLGREGGALAVGY